MIRFFFLTFGSSISFQHSFLPQIENSGFSYGWSQHESSDLTPGTVVGQSLDAFSSAEEHSMIYLTVSDGPEVQS